jgi:hypothetical protein
VTKLLPALWTALFAAYAAVTVPLLVWALLRVL